MMKREGRAFRDVKTEKFTISWDEKERILLVRFIGDQGESEAKEYAAKLRSIMGTLKDKGEVVDKGIVDLTKAGKPSLGARKQYMEVTDEYTEGVENGKIAYVGADVFNEVVARFIHSFNTFLVKIGYFASISEAKEWLKKPQ
jgi:hypothetical protein